MSHEILRVLGNWSASSHGAEVVRFVSPYSFSGAAIWRVEAGEQVFALRRWPPQMQPRHLRYIHRHQVKIAVLGPPVIPVLQKTIAGFTFCECNGGLWELATWRPGTADYRQHPRPERLTAAMRTLAAIHNASIPTSVMTWMLSLEQAEGRDARAAAVATGRCNSEAIWRRTWRLHEIVHGKWSVDAAEAISAAAAPDRILAHKALSLISRLAPRELEKSRHWRTMVLPLKFVLGDVHQDNVLFTGDEVTGVVDFGAANHDSPALDVARLLGSFVGDDRDARRRGLDAYQALDPLSTDELAAVDFFDSSGTVTAAANWITWLWGEPERRLDRSANEAHLARLAWLVKRMRVLASNTT